MNHILQLSDVDSGRNEQIDLERNLLTYTDGDGRLVTMNLTTSDVHTDTAMAGAIVGYRLRGMLADLVAPVVLKDKQSDFYYITDPDDVHQLAQGAVTAPGANVKEIAPRISTSAFNAKGYALASFVPTEVETNADTPLRPGILASRRVMNALVLGREYRVATALTTAGTYAAAQKVDLSGSAATLKWNGGSAPDPIGNMLALMEGARTMPTHFVMTRRTFNAFYTNANVQKYIQYKDTMPPLAPAVDGETVTPYIFPGLLPILVSDQKYKAADGTLQYVWGNNVVAVRIPPNGLQQDGEDIASMLTFRWRINAEDARVQNGISVRSWFENGRGPNGGRKVVVNHYDAEVMVDATAGGIIVGAYA